jgi:hypothetical protein
MEEKQVFNSKLLYLVSTAQIVSVIHAAIDNSAKILSLNLSSSIEQPLRYHAY